MQTASVKITTMNASLGAFRAALLTGWFALSVAAVLYARSKGVPGLVGLPVAAAFLIAYPFYLAVGFASVREYVGARFTHAQIAAALVASAVLPYLVCSLGGGFSLLALIRLAAVAILFSYWYIVLPVRPWSDLGYLLLLMAVQLRGYFEGIYLPPQPGLKIEVLGNLSLLWVTVFSMTQIRGMREIRYGFLPTRQEWAAGARYFLLFLVIGFPLAVGLGWIRFQPPPNWPGKMALIFLSTLWAISLAEEFYFRGLLQQWLQDWSGRAWFALVTCSVVFGLCHLGFRQFPNWRIALLAGLAGLFYGHVYQRTGSIRASMAAHTLVVTVWRTFFV